MLLEAFACSSHLSSCWHLLDSTSSSWRPWRDRLDGASFGAVAAACQREQLPRRCEEMTGENKFGKHIVIIIIIIIIAFLLQKSCPFNKLLITEFLLLTAEFGASALSWLPSTILSRYGDRGKSGNHRGDGGKRNIAVLPAKSKNAEKCLKISIQKHIFYILFLWCYFSWATSAESARFEVEFWISVNFH